MHMWKYVHHIHFPGIKMFSASDYMTYVNKLSMSEILTSARKSPSMETCHLGTCKSAKEFFAEVQHYVFLPHFGSIMI